MSPGSARREDVLERDRRDGRRRGVEEWRGVAAEHDDEVAERVSGLLKKRSRALLADLLKPYLKTVWLLVAVVVIETPPGCRFLAWSSSASTTASRRCWPGVAGRCSTRSSR